MINLNPTKLKEITDDSCFIFFPANSQNNMIFNFPLLGMKYHKICFVNIQGQPVGFYASDTNME